VEDNSTNQIKSLKITSIKPSSGKIGDIVTISGSNFGSVQDSGFVKFNLTNASEYISWSDTLVEVKVPLGATSGKVSISRKGNNSNEVDFRVFVVGPGNYEVIHIGNLGWMRNNLNVDHYSNGDIIPQVNDPQKWISLKTGAWCYYNNDSLLGAIYGKLYNWYAVNDPRGLAPSGWHIPNDLEWKTLILTLGDVQVAGGKMKEIGLTHWKEPNLGATNESDFSALPGGWRTPDDGIFDQMGLNGYWWSSMEDDNVNAWKLDLNYGNIRAGWYYYYKTSGFSIRCVLD
jgi:uncharacterized protein (TIGR02145 family)